jgi:hypothetical protein
MNTSELRSAILDAADLEDVLAEARALCARLPALRRLAGAGPADVSEAGGQGSGRA